jgi:hypothetical protein
LAQRQFRFPFTLVSTVNPGPHLAKTRLRGVVDADVPAAVFRLIIDSRFCATSMVANVDYTFVIAGAEAVIPRMTRVLSLPGYNFRLAAVKQHDRQPRPVPSEG